VASLQRLQPLDWVQQRNLAAIQVWFASQDPTEYVDLVFRIAGIEYAVMTNIPFEPEEAHHWLGDPSKCILPAMWSRTYFRSALRVDQLLLGIGLRLPKPSMCFNSIILYKGVYHSLFNGLTLCNPSTLWSVSPFRFNIYPSQ
jgi:hypothetical protein